MGIRLVAALAIGAATLSPEPASACSCAPPGSPCESAWQAEAVFVGHVVSIESTSVSGRRAQLAVVEPFRGIRSSQVTLATGSGGADCGYPFRIGESYVVYAYRSPAGELATSSCSRTRPVATATADLTYLRSLAAIGPGDLARVAGRVQLWESPPRSGGAPPMPGLVVTAKSAAGTFSARTNDTGDFELTGLPRGEYELVATAAGGYHAIPRTVKVDDPRGCGTTVLYVRHDARVSGRVVDARGAGVPGLPLTLVRPDEVEARGGRSTRVQARTAGDGTFELGLVDPGEYLLGFDAVRAHDGALTFSRLFFPGVRDPAGARRLTISQGQRLKVPDFVVPVAVRLVTIRGVVVDEAGRPVKDAAITLSDNTEGPNIIGPRALSGGDGGFVFSVVEGERYEVHVSRTVGSARGGRDIQVATLPFTAAASSSPLRVVMKPGR
jgi:hypothetical protein